MPNKSGPLFKVSSVVGCLEKTTSSFWLVNSWYEREVSEFFNIGFLGSYDSRSLLLPYSYINVVGGYSSTSDLFYAVKYDTTARVVSPILRYNTKI